MKEIKIYLDPEQQIEADGRIVFEEIVAGEITKKSIYVQNVIDYPINIEIELEGKHINIVKTIDTIKYKETKEVVFEFTPKITIIKPITANLKIKINYIIT